MKDKLVGHNLCTLIVYYNRERKRKIIKLEIEKIDTEQCTFTPKTTKITPKKVHTPTLEFNKRMNQWLKKHKINTNQIIVIF